MARKSQDVGTRTGCPFTNRRQVMFGLAGGAVALGTSPAWSADSKTPDQGSTVAPRSTGIVPFRGFHQAGITTPRPGNGIMCAYDVVISSPDDLEAMLRLLTRRIALLTTGTDYPERDPALPPDDSGILGADRPAENLTVTVGLGASLFERHAWLAGLKPRLLKRMDQSPNDALEADRCHGDISIQFCASLQDTNIHALRDINKHLSQYLVMRWMQEGDVAMGEPEAPPESARNFLGFRDGSANLDAADTGLMDTQTWVSTSNDEPAWAHGGTYQAVRIIRNFVERWDRTPLGEQEHLIGRHKMSGTPLSGGRSEFDVPDYANDPGGLTTPLDAHIRLANPRTAQTRDSLILRRPFNYSNGITLSGQLDQGLLFICYQADLERGFIAVQKRLDGEPLEEYIQPVGGGFFFVLPGIGEGDDFLGSGLLRTARQLL